MYRCDFLQFIAQEIITPIHIQQQFIISEMLPVMGVQFIDDGMYPRMQQ